ncbi:hypothetical protein [Mesorhizobium sp.]|uniref:hypothetical protein n=1 Tax=Mesorhizobium sp. TaxID=1871066 RepID=UPI0025F38602|nr:hypothetical protein [Mesorhizobium sp.]
MPRASAAFRKLLALATSTNSAMSFKWFNGLLHKWKDDFYTAGFILIMEWCTKESNEWRLTYFGGTARGYIDYAALSARADAVHDRRLD